jgi:hypothetical protein
MFVYFAQKKKKNTQTHTQNSESNSRVTSHIFFHLPAFLLNNLDSPSKLCNMSKLDSSSLVQKNQCTGDHSKNLNYSKRTPKEEEED